jgi:hypothetical protein
LISSASIDENNVSYKLVNNQIVEEIHNVITAHSKSLLFNNIVSEIEKRIGLDISICSTPIVGSNTTFNDAIRSRTIPT